MPYNGKLDAGKITEWIIKKVGMPSNRIDSHKQLIQKVHGIESLVVFVGTSLSAVKSTASPFRTFLEVAKDLLAQDDLEFAHIDTLHYAKEELELLNLAESVYLDRGYTVRVFRRRNIRDFTEFAAHSESTDPSSFTHELLSDFIVRSSFVGPGPDIIRELSNESAMKIFSYNKPVLILFRNTSAHDA